MQCQIKFISHMEISFLCMSFVLIRDREVCECVSVGQCETPPDGLERVWDIKCLSQTKTVHTQACDALVTLPQR